MDFNLPRLQDLDVSGKRVLVRADLDVETLDFEKDLRIQSLIPTLDYLKKNGAEIILLGHRGRPGGVVDQSLSLKPFQPFFERWGARVEENLRFDPGEEKNNPEFARKLAGLGDCYVNEAFAASDRQHASIVGVPKLLPHAAGFRFAQEIENLSKVSENPKRPLVVIIAGVKEDKLSYIEPLSKIADKVLIAGRLPEFIQSSNYYLPSTNVIVADLLPDREDITIRSMEKFEEEIKKAGTIVLAGLIGKYEDLGHKQGTERVFRAVTNSNAYKIAGGGDTIRAIDQLQITNDFNWLSVGGGAMLGFLAKKTLLGIEALLGS